MTGRWCGPPAIETQIDVAVDLTLEDLKARLYIASRLHPNYLCSETLVHLVRLGQRTSNDRLMGIVFPVLLMRCQENLVRKVPDGGLPTATTVREEVLGQFSELFARDGTGTNPDELDFYECKFNRASRFFRIDVVRLEMNRLMPLRTLPAADESQVQGSEEEIFARVSEAFRSPATQEAETALSELQTAIQRIPHEEREAIVLVCALGYQEESKDPAQETAAVCSRAQRLATSRLRVITMG